MKPAVVSTELGSVAEPPRLMAVPSGLVAGAPLIDGASGATLVTAIVLEVTVPMPPSLSVAVRVTT